MEHLNYFDPKNAAERYSNGRPYFHSETILRIKQQLQLTSKLDKALDIACGTGLSTKALLDIAIHVYGTDSSEEMLKRACLQDQLSYSIASAENQPFPNAEFQLITVCSGVHWFNIDQFLIEANRLLTSKAYLVLYDNFFLSEMTDMRHFSDWYHGVYLEKFPPPKRNDTYNWSSENLTSKNFHLETTNEFKNTVTFTKAELILYFTTQSNVTAAVEGAQTTYSEIENWLDQELSSFFLTEQKRQLSFGNWIKYLRKIEKSGFMAI